MGVHVLDVLVRPVEAIPEGQGGVDTTGCGDAFSAGFLRGLALGRERRDAAVLGCAAAALVAQGLGTDPATSTSPPSSRWPSEW